MAKAEVTPWFLAATDGLPVREGRYQVRFCIGWREVFCVFRRGAWWVGGGGLDKPARVNLKRWPGFHWRGLAHPNPADWAACMRKKLDDLRHYEEAAILPDRKPPNVGVERPERGASQ